MAHQSATVAPVFMGEKQKVVVLPKVSVSVFEKDFKCQNAF